MSKKIILQKATRIEGNADIHIEVEDGRVKAARFMVQDFRGFEKFCQGKEIESVPHMVSRICGLCCTAHQVAGFRAVENALGIKVTESVYRLREIALLAETIASHALSYFFLTLPDQVGASDGIFDLKKSHPEIASKAFYMRKAGNRMLELISRRAVHPVAIGVGTFLALPTVEALEEIKGIALKIKDDSLQHITNLEKGYKRTSFVPFPKAHETNFFTYDDRPDVQRFRAFNLEGKNTVDFDLEDFEEKVSEMRVDWSFAKLPYLEQLGFPDGIMLVGPISRLFVEGGVLDDPDLKGNGLVEALRQTKTLNLDDYDTCRLFEIFHASKKILEHIEHVDLSDLAPPAFDRTASGAGIGVVEAPRGVLVHSYMVKDGVVDKMKLYVATQFNNAYINMVLKDLAESYVEGDSISTEGQELLGRCVRLFDPCLTCATH
jgi:coenzyme F420-reducing hydrogenase alpha subunit